MNAFTDELKQHARELGFRLAGVCHATAPPRWDQFQAWLDAGFAGQMHYFETRRQAYEHPRHVLADVRGLLLLGLDYRTAESRAVAAGHGRVATYAWGEADYHDLIHARLRLLRDFVLGRFPQAKVRGIVDTAPLLEREFAELAGLGWIGKNTLLLAKPTGSLFFLAALLTDLDLTPDAPLPTGHCGTCTACLDACPTNAFPRPFVLEARRCISYLTIEHRGPIPEELRTGIGDWLFGCDICQDVCPWNRQAPISSEPSLQPRGDQNPIDLVGLFDLDDAAFRARFRKTPLWRPKRRGLLRNAAIVLGNQRSEQGVAALIRGLADPEPVVREAAAWALLRIGTPRALSAVRERQTLESDPLVVARLAEVDSIGAPLPSQSPDD